MLVKFFKRGEGEHTRGEDVLDYMLGAEWKKDHQIIREGASLIRGNPQHTTAIINNSVYKKKYLSGCLSFHADEKIDPALQEKLMNDFEECLLPGLDKDQYSVYWVKHQDKKDPETGELRLELNFIFACTELRSNKKLNVYYHYADVRRIDAWQSIQNYDYQLLDPKDPIRTYDLTIHKNHRISDENRFNKQAIREFIESRIQAGAITNRATLVNVLTSNGYKLSRQGENYISIENPNGQNIKLTGNYFKKDFDAQKIVFTLKEEQSRIWHEQREQKMPAMKMQFAELMTKRQADLYERHVKNNAGFGQNMVLNEPLEVIIENELGNDETVFDYVNNDTADNTTNNQNTVSSSQNIKTLSDEPSQIITTKKTRTQKKTDDKSVDNLTNTPTQPATKSTQVSDKAAAKKSPLSAINQPPGPLQQRKRKEAFAQIVYLDVPTLQAQDDNYGESGFTTDTNAINDFIRPIFKRAGDTIVRRIRRIATKIGSSIRKCYRKFSNLVADTIGGNRERRRKVNRELSNAYHSTERLNRELEKRNTQANLTFNLAATAAKQAEQTTGRIDAIVGGQRRRNQQFTATADKFKSKVDAAWSIDKNQPSINILLENQPLLQAIIRHYHDLCQAKMIPDNGLEYFPLFRGFKPFQSMQLNQCLDKYKNGWNDENNSRTKSINSYWFLLATMDYKRALLGIEMTEDEHILALRHQNGVIGHFELLDLQQKKGWYDEKNKQHVTLKQQNKLLANYLNDQMRALFNDLGGNEYYLVENYFDSAQSDLDGYMTFEQMLKKIDTLIGLEETHELEPEQKVTVSQTPEPRRSRPRGP